MDARARSVVLGVAAVATVATPAAADSTAPVVSIVSADDDGSGRDWILPEPGVGPELGALARLELGTAGLAIDDGRGGVAVTAGLARVRFAGALGDAVGVRGAATVQALTAREGTFPLPFGVDAGGALSLGVSRRLLREKPGGVPVAATLDGELATGLAVRSGLGMRSLSDARRLTLAPGVAAATDLYVATVRGHARYLVTDGDAGDGVELGLGASMRINWGSKFWGGSWPLEAWADYRHRRGTGGSTAREHEVRGGLDYTPGRWLDRVGVQVAGTRDRLDGGPSVRGLAMLLIFQRGTGG